MSAELDALFETHIRTLAASLDIAVQSAWDTYEPLRQAGQKGELAHMYISFLFSSVLCKLPWLRVDLYDEHDRADITECYADWDVPQISGKLYADTDALAEQNKLKDYEAEQACLHASGEYFQAFEKALPQIIEQCTSAAMVRSQWHYGQFLGNTVVVREKKQDAIF